MKYILFITLTYYPAGGIYDAIKDGDTVKKFDTIEDAIEAVKNHPEFKLEIDGDYHIIDENFNIVHEGSFWDLQH